MTGAIASIAQHDGSLGRANVVSAIVGRADQSAVMVMIRRMVVVVVVMVVMSGIGRGGCSGGCCCCRSRAVGVGVAVPAAGLLPLAVFLVLHPPVLEPDLHLTLRQVEVAGQLPALLFGHVGVEEELLFQFQRLELGVRLPLLAHRHLAGPLERIGTERTFWNAKEEQKRVG